MPSSTSRRWAGSSREGARVRHGSATAIAARSSARDSGAFPDAAAARRARRSIARTPAGSSPPSRAASTCLSRARVSTRGSYLLAGGNARQLRANRKA